MYLISKVMPFLYRDWVVYRNIMTNRLFASKGENQAVRSACNRAEIPLSEDTRGDNEIFSILELHHA